MLSHLDIISACDRHRRTDTDGQTDILRQHSLQIGPKIKVIKMVLFESMCKVSYSHSIATVSCVVSDISRY